MRGWLLGAAMTLALAAPAIAQDNNKETLADIQKEIGQLSAQLRDLRSELVSSGSQGLQAAGGTSALERMNTMEAQLTQLTSRTEELQNRIERVVKDGSNRIGDLEFRVCDLEEGCDPASLSNDPLGGPTTKSKSKSGGGAAAVSAPAASSVSSASSGSGSSDMTVNEQSDFDRAKGVLGQGDFRGAADLFKTYAQTYPGGPLTPDAMYMQGEALSQAGDTAGAAKAWLDAFSADPKGPRAPDNLFELGKALGALGQKSAACTTLQQVSVRFPDSQAAGNVGAAMSSLGCQ